MTGGCRECSTVLKLYDVVRIDHFRGFDEYYAIPYGDDDRTEWQMGKRARNGTVPSTLNKKIREPARDRRGSWIPDRERSGNAERKRISGNESSAVCF